ncbi:MAG: hypothetical protein CEO22_361 [Candidatus Berkelbacteria bacterium Gr01-1014_85]|uniref:Uncharacterized protein n=1 Tax=Candidatus Berkelbacteria bacterium Gr01-1014_85 TaxID=2017150 RepID=A0A554JBN1_9BACT|nr:MAG: hypothetical protein CEO22_361 [Candidatus Berkelbacteria bacterium Gr01-1014_85]
MMVTIVFLLSSACSSTASTAVLLPNHFMLAFRSGFNYARQDQTRVVLPAVVCYRNQIIGTGVDHQILTPEAQAIAKKILAIPGVISCSFSNKPNTDYQYLIVETAELFPCQPEIRADAQRIMDGQELGKRPSRPLIIVMAYDSQFKRQITVDFNRELGQISAEKPIVLRAYRLSTVEEREILQRIGTPTSELVTTLAKELGQDLATIELGPYHMCLQFSFFLTDRERTEEGTAKHRIDVIARLLQQKLEKLP